MSLALDPELIERLDEDAAIMGVSRSEYVNRTLRQILAAEE